MSTNANSGDTSAPDNSNAAIIGQITGDLWFQELPIPTAMADSDGQLYSPALQQQIEELMIATKPEMNELVFIGQSPPVPAIPQQPNVGSQQASHQNVVSMDVQSNAVSTHSAATDAAIQVTTASADSTVASVTVQSDQTGSVSPRKRRRVSSASEEVVSDQSLIQQLTEENKRLVAIIVKCEKCSLKAGVEGNERFVCHFAGCGKSYGRRKDLIYHQKLKEHTIACPLEPIRRAKQFVCNFPGCDKSYYWKQDLNKHQRDKEHTIVCEEQVERSVQGQVDLREGPAQHSTGEQREQVSGQLAGHGGSAAQEVTPNNSQSSQQWFVCQFPGCGKPFAWIQSLNKHQRDKKHDIPDIVTQQSAKLTTDGIWKLIRDTMADNGGSGDQWLASTSQTYQSQSQRSGGGDINSQVLTYGCVSEEELLVKIIEKTREVANCLSKPRTSEGGIKGEVKMPLLGKSSNTRYSPRSGVTLKKDSQNTALTTARTHIMRLKRMKSILLTIQSLIDTKTYLTKRGMYYQKMNLLKDCVRKQVVVDAIIDQIACDLGVGRIDLHIIASTKGLVFGDLHFVNTNGYDTDCLGSPNGINIPNNTAKTSDFRSTAKFILLVEKDTIFQQLIQLKIHEQYKLIMITAHGYPDINTRAFLRILWNTFQLPIYALVDGDGHGLEIVCNYKFGSYGMAYEASNLVVPPVQWLGVKPSDIADHKLPKQALIPLSMADRKKIMDLKDRDYVKSNAEYGKQLDILLAIEHKVEIDALAYHGQDYLFKTFLPSKLPNTANYN